MVEVLIGPANYAGQAYEWARALRLDGVAARAVTGRRRPYVPLMKPPPVTYPTDVAWPYKRLTTGLGRMRRARALLTGDTYFALDGFVSVLGGARARLSGRELAMLAARTRGMALIAHGSDIRDPDRHAQRIEDSYFTRMPPDRRKFWVERAAHNRSLPKEVGLPLLVSTPDLLIDAPGATWLPVCIDVPSWGANPPTIAEKPRVLHVPSNSTVKGSDVIDPALGELHDAGRIDYVRASGVDRAAMRELVHSADLVVDQVRSGFYGVAAVEAMAAGRAVVGYVADDVRALVPDPIPVIDAPAGRFAQRIGEILDDREQWATLGRTGVEFATKWHDGRRSAAALRDIWDLGST